VNSTTSNSSEDSAAALEKTPDKKIDTIIIKDREVCFWHHTLFGEWELRCYRTSYSDYWHSYYNRPWWYHQSFYKSYNCHCPYHITFHPNCTYCWFHCDKYSFLNHHNQNKKKNIYNKSYKINSTANKKTQSADGATPEKPEVKGPGKSGGRTKQGTVIVGKKPKQGSTAHIPKIPEKLIIQKQKAAVTGKIPLEKAVSDSLTDSLVLDTTKTESLDTTTIDSTNKILLKPKSGKHRSRRKY
jgi:hypothetical protein